MLEASSFASARRWFLCLWLRDLSASLGITKGCMGIYRIENRESSIISV